MTSTQSHSRHLLPLRVHILGTRGNVRPSAPRYARHAGILVDRRILLDLGEPSYLRHRPEAIFISHLHPDHAALADASRLGGIDVYVPEPVRALPAVKVIAGPVEVGGLRIVPVPTEHSLQVRSVGFVVEKGPRRVFYSADLFAIAPRHRARFGRLDLVITEGSFMRRGGLVRTDAATGRRYGHAGLPELIDLFGRFTDRILVTHFGSWFYRDIPEGRRRIAALGDGTRVSAAHDGMVLVV